MMIGHLSILTKKKKERGNKLGNLIAGLWPGHDCAYCILDENGKPIIHAELERYNREKCAHGNPFELMTQRSSALIENIKYFGLPFPSKKMETYQASISKMKDIVTKNNGKIFYYPHHYCHAANAFYSSNLKEAIVLTMDGGGSENEAGGETCCTVWSGYDNSLTHLNTFTPREINIGGVWSRVTRYVFGLQNGWPRGGQEGTVMAMAALGNPKKYYDDFIKMLTVDKLAAGFKPPNQPPGPRIEGKDPKHPYLDKWYQIAEVSDQEKYDLAAGLQLATENLIRYIIDIAIKSSGKKKVNLCLSGGVTLNSVAMGKIKQWFPESIENIYIPPVPYDAGLAIGAAQIIFHQALSSPRIKWNTEFPSYLGELWTETINDEINKTNHNNEFNVTDATDHDVINLLKRQKIIAIFNEKSESGRRALGNRSILADPRSPNMKDIINEKVKHRQWFRPFAPSILSDHVNDWFEQPIDSPYMQFVIPFKKSVQEKVPAVVHFDGTARLQTVTKEHNPWYYNLLTMWNKQTGVPILLNTSFNDREPICESPIHAINCFRNTNIDCLYFPEVNKLLTKVEK